MSDAPTLVREASPGTQPKRLPRSSGTSEPTTTSGIDSPPTTHITLQSKGGVGKTFVASVVAQYLRDRGRQVRCFDADPGNRSLSKRAPALTAEVVALLDPQTGELNVDALDQMMQACFTETGDVVVDGGASSFFALADYIVRNDIGAMLDERGRQTVLHSILVGEPDTQDTVGGLVALAKQIPEPVKIVVWLNEQLAGPVRIGKVPFVESDLYKQYASRIGGVVALPELSSYFETDVRSMITSRKTFDEAIGSTTIMQAQRLTQTRRAIWQQLDQVLGLG